MPEMVAPRALVFPPLIKGNEDSGNEIGVENILVPSATRLKMSLTSSSGRAKKLEFVHWLTKNECAGEIKIQSSTHSILLPVRVASSLS